MCGTPLQMSASNNNDDISWSKDHKFLVRQARDRITLFIKSDYYVQEGKRDFEFTISILDGNVIHCEQTSRFISLYDLDILLTKSCVSCANKYPKEAFQKNIRIYYNRNDSRFVSENYTEYFFVINDNIGYRFCNDFKINQSFLYVYDINSQNKISEHPVPFLSFEKFNFIYKHKLISKLQSIQILA
jgi:hypothetical protein